MRIIVFYVLEIKVENIKLKFMSGDNLHGKQPIKFYSEIITLTKVELLEKQLSLGEKVSNLEEKHKEWSRKLSS